jgi:hypothetical protein
MNPTRIGRGKVNRPARKEDVSVQDAALFRAQRTRYRKARLARICN